MLEQFQQQIQILKTQLADKQKQNSKMEDDIKKLKKKLKTALSK